MRIWDVELGAEMIQAIVEHGEREYPSEACGLILASRADGHLTRVVPLKNVQDRYHARDPAQFPRTSRDAFRVDELERLRILEAAEASGEVERAIYHSHCDAGAYFSPEDRAMAVVDGAELAPGALYLVVSIRGGKRRDMAAFRFDAARRAFEEARVPLVAIPLKDGLPDLETRTMEGSEAARPIAPVGAGLVIRRVSADERAGIVALTSGRRVAIGAAEARDLARLGAGLLSPLAGFMRSAEIGSVEAQGRLLVGTPWRVPISLLVRAPAFAVEPGTVIELADEADRALGAVGVSEVEGRPAGRLRVAGPAFAYPDASSAEGIVDAPDTRAELLRRGMRRVLAIPPIVRPEAIVRAKLAGFDGLLTPEPSSHDRARWIRFPLAGRDGWTDAVMAQNLGATHIWIDDSDLAASIRETLAIIPWNPTEP
jgi:proteasome lid subunit RPN8/RPN11